MNRLLIVLVSVICVMSATTVVYAEEPITQAFDDWVLICQDRENAVPCDIRHRVVDEQSQSQVLVFSIAYSAEQEQYALQLILPLDFLLKPGVGLQAEDYQVERIEVTRCEPVGCLVEARLDHVAVDALRNAAAGYVFLTARDGQRVGLPFSLKGFTGASDALVDESEFRRADG